ncbi:MAG: NHL repeat-containing protein, partial [Anaerolineae bacterium]|nr:NHL repeat-containing protein [Anaerolineae bacterium]
RMWAVLLLAPVFLIGLANVIGPFVFNQPPFAGLERVEQMRTFTWIGALVLTAVTGYGMYWLATTPRRNKASVTLFRLGELQVGYIARRRLDPGQALRVLVVGIFALLAVLTARHAWMAAYINYDLATEYLVYAHGAPSNKIIVNYLTEMSQRLTDGMNIQVAYDDKFSWPGSWYMRQFPSAVFLGDANNASGWENYQAVIIDTDKSARLEPQFADRFYRFDMIRLWWPMQDYFGLTMQRIDNALGDGEMRQGLWDIWWSRSYDTYGAAKARMAGSSPDEFDIDKWPVAERLAFYVRKDVAAQLWDFGVGAARVSGLPADPFNTLRCDTCAAETAWTAAPGAFNAPRGVAVGPDGNIYVADTQNSRIVVLAPTGEMLRTFGALSVTNDADPAGPPLGTLREPWGVAVDAEGRVIVADTWNHRVQIFTADGEPLAAWGMFERVDPTFSISGSSTGFYGPRDVEVDAEGRIYVADTGNKRVRVYDSTGGYLMDIGSEGSQPGQLLEPVGLAISDATGELFVASTWNKRIDVFSLDGSFLRSWDVPAWYGNTATADSGNRPYLALDRTGRYLFVTDPDSARVLVYDTNGAPVLQFGRLGSAPYGLGQFGVLGGIAFDEENRLVMADAGAARIVRFASGAFPGLMVEVEAPPEALPTEAIQPTPTGRIF